MTFEIGPWWALALAWPVLLLGETLVRHVRVFAAFNIPVPVVGGLSVALAALAAHAFGSPISFDLDTTARWWLWIVNATPHLSAEQPQGQAVYYPLMVGFFACIGLGASPSVLRKGGVALALFLAVTTVLAALQMLVGVAVARAVGVSPLLGLLCGAISMTGGHGTSAAFAPLVEGAGLPDALGIAIVAATFGLVAGGLVGGPVGAMLIGRRGLATPFTEQDPNRVRSRSDPSTFLGQLASLIGKRSTALWHIAALAMCLKLGAWVSFWLGSLEIAGTPIVLPGYIGAMIVGIALRMGLELTGRRVIQDGVVTLMMFVCLDLFLAVAVMSVDLVQLAGVALPMLVILAAQVVAMVIFASTVTFRLMGGDYNAAVLSAGHCGFGLGASPNAVANMESLVKRYGPAPDAFFVLPLSAGFLLDFTNAAVISLSIGLLS